jgi:uncharacterized protein YqeY
VLKQRIQDDMKIALKARDSRRLGVIRLILAAVKQREVDERVELDDSQVVAVLDKMVKQRRDALAQFQAAGRAELAAQEAYEIEVCRAYLPEALEAGQIVALIEQALDATGAASVKDMGRVMGWLKPRIQGRADMAAVSAKVRQRLAG